MEETSLHGQVKRQKPLFLHQLNRILQGLYKSPCEPPPTPPGVGIEAPIAERVKIRGPDPQGEIDEQPLVQKAG